MGDILRKKTQPSPFVLLFSFPLSRPLQRESNRIFTLIPSSLLSHTRNIYTFITLAFGQTGSAELNYPHLSPATLNSAIQSNYERNIFYVVISFLLLSCSTGNHLRPLGGFFVLLCFPSSSSCSSLSLTSLVLRPFVFFYRPTFFYCIFRNGVGSDVVIELSHFSVAFS